MKKIILFCFIISNSILANSFITKFKTSSYDSAKHEKQFFKFIGTSTKMGFISTEFDGYAKEFEIHYDTDEHKKTLTKILIQIPSHSFDTDNSMRDGKLHEKCLKEKENPFVTAQFTGPIDLSHAHSGTINIEFKAVKKVITIPLNYEIIKNGNETEVSFNSSFSFKEAEIEDPSIAIAKLQEIFKLEGRFTLN